MVRLVPFQDLKILQDNPGGAVHGHCEAKVYRPHLHAFNGTPHIVELADLLFNARNDRAEQALPFIEEESSSRFSSGTLEGKRDAKCHQTPKRVFV